MKKYFWFLTMIIFFCTLLPPFGCTKSKTDKSPGGSTPILIKKGPRKAVAKTPPKEFFEKIIKTSQSGKSLFGDKKYEILDFGRPYKDAVLIHFPFLVQIEGAPFKQTFELVKDSDGNFRIREQKLLPKQKHGK